MGPRVPQAAGRLGSKRILQMTPDERTVLRVFGLFLLALFSLVYCDGSLVPRRSEGAAAKPGSWTGKPTAAKEPASSPVPVPHVHYGTDGLPPPVEEMRETILSAVRSGRIEDLRHAWELNELKPDLGLATSDPIAHWKEISGDGEGREILAALAQILDAGTWCCRSARTSRTTASTCGPILPRCRSID